MGGYTMGAKNFILITIFSIIFSSTASSFNPPKFKDGDIIFQTNTSLQGKMMESATKFKYNHAGVIFYIKNKPYVFECYSNVTFTPLDKWIRRGAWKKYIVKRLKERDNYITPLSLSVMKKNAIELKDKHYDYYFEWSDAKMYNAELIWKLFYNSLGIKLCELQILSDFDINSPLIKPKLKARFGKHIPYNEKVVSIEKIFNSSLLITFN